MKASDILLMPKSLFERLSDRKEILYAGITAIGLIDTGFFIYDNYRDFFLDKSSGELFLNVLLSILLVLVIGFVDVFFFSRPMFDLCNYFKSRQEKKEDFQKVSIVKIIKVYILAHLPILPLNIALYAYEKNIAIEQSTLTEYIGIIIVFGIIHVWFSEIISRGFTVLYKFKFEYGRVVFVSVFMWAFLTGIAIDYVIRVWIMKVFIL